MPRSRTTIVRGLVEPAQARGSRHPAGHPSDDHDALHAAPRTSSCACVTPILYPQGYPFVTSGDATHAACVAGCADVRRPWLTRNLRRAHRWCRSPRTPRASCSTPCCPCSSPACSPRRRSCSGSSRAAPRRRPASRSTSPAAGPTRAAARPFVTAGYGLAALGKVHRGRVVRLAAGARRPGRRPARQGCAVGAARRAHRGVGPARGLRPGVRVPPHRRHARRGHRPAHRPRRSRRCSTATSARCCGGRSYPPCCRCCSPSSSWSGAANPERQPRRRRDRGTRLDVGVRQRARCGGGDACPPAQPAAAVVLAGDDRARRHRGRELPRRPPAAARERPRLLHDAGRARLRRLQPRLHARLLPRGRVVGPPAAPAGLRHRAARVRRGVRRSRPGREGRVGVRRSWRSTGCSPRSPTGWARPGSRRSSPTSTAAARRACSSR